MGVTLREMVFDVGGGITRDRQFKAVQIGGPSGGCVTERASRPPVDYDSLRLRRRDHGLGRHGRHR